MCKHLCKLFLFSMVLTPLLFAQVPNSGFEQWTNGEPDGWWTSNSALLNWFLVTQTNDKHSGEWAVRGDIKVINGSIVQPIIISGEIGQKGFPISQRYANVSGYYKMFSNNGDKLNVLAVLFKNGQGVGVGGNQFLPVNAYTNFTFQILYSNGLIPDSCQISVTIAKGTSTFDTTAYFIVDDITLDGIATSVEDEHQISTFKLEQNYPNPFNPTTKIKYTIPTVGIRHALPVQLKVYDILGNQVAEVINEKQQPGNYEVDFDSGKYNLPSGVYFYKLEAGSYIQTKKMILLR